MPSTAAGNTQLSALNILIVNQDPHALELIGSQLAAAGFSQITMVNSAVKALQALRQQRTDLLIVDVETQDMDGWRLSRLVRSGILTCRADLPIVIIARTWCERIAEVTAREYGINALLPLEHLDQLPGTLRQLSDAPLAGLPKPRLLVVEDQPDTADLIKRLLSSNFDIEFAYDGEAGLSAWKAGRQDLVLLDVMLPKMSGREVLVEIQRLAPQQPVVIMTAHTTIDQAEELMLLGAVDFLPKPFRSEQLRKVCEIAIHREDFLVSNAQFAARVRSLQERELAFRKLYETHHQLLDDLQTVVLELDEQFRVVFLNRAWELLMGFTREQSLGRNLSDFIAPEERNLYERVQEQMRLSLRQPQTSAELELCLFNQQRQKLWVQLKISKSSTSENNSRLTVCMDNVTERRATQEQLQFLAMHDSLTGLFNRHYFESSLEQLTADALRNRRQHALVYIDLDHFKVINDTFGHQKGDEALREMAQLLGHRIRKPDILCRLGGDEFAVLLHDVDGQQAHSFAQNIQSIIGDFSFHSNGQRISLGSSIGLSLINDSTATAQEHLMRADIALYVAKGRGRNLIHIYNPQDSESDELRRRLSISQKVRKAIAEDRMLLYFQPIVDARLNQVAYYEALVRMRDSDGKIIGPGEFIPALETSGEMHLLDRWIIKLATRQLKQHPQLRHIAINLSAQAFKDESLLPTIVESIRENEINPAQITFELTESASLFNLHITQRVIAELHKLGCSFSVDDFGSGFSSFAYLKELPADYIKLDGSFIQNLHRDPVDQTLVKSIIQVVQALGKKAVAEYVENAEILTILKTMGIDLVQGYHLGHPQPVEKILRPAPAKNSGGKA